MTVIEALSGRTMTGEILNSPTLKVNPVAIAQVA
jgi:hypothetical protein